MQPLITFVLPPPPDTHTRQSHNTDRGTYEYTRDLWSLHTSNPNPCSLPGKLQLVHTPLQADAWQHYLGKHPDQAFVKYLLSGMRSGFRIGFNPTQQLQRSSKNMLSAHAHPEVVSEQFSKDCKKGYTLGPLHPADFPQVHTSRIGVIPKKYQEGKWRLIVDLSAPRGKSVNDGIKRELCSLHYVKVDDIVNQVLQMGRGTLLAKLDVKSAFRIVPVHPADRHLLGMEWEGQLYIDNSLPFGLRSAPKIFNAIADALEWILRQHGVSNIWHYLDDFLLAGTRSSGECARYLHTVIRLCQILGIPLAEEKLAGPATVLAILGIEFDTDRLMLRLPKEKFQRLKQMLAERASKRSCTRKELQSLIRQLQHAW